MAKKKKMVFGANEKATENLKNTTDYSAPQEGYPITFGRGEWTDGVFATIAAKDDEDAKIRFIWKVDGTDSGAIYAGNQLVSSKILDITTNATADEPATEVTVKFIGSDSTIQETKFGVVDPESLGALEERVQALETWAKSGDIITGTEGGAVTVTPSDEQPAKYTISVNVDGDDVSILDDNKITVSKYFIEKVQDASTEYSAQYKLMVQKPGSDEFEQAGDTINIFKDFFLKNAHVCTFNKKADGSDWVIIDPTKIDDLGSVYAEIPEDQKDYADVSVEITDQETGAVTIMYLEKAPLNHGLYLNHTYLHLIVNTLNNDEIQPEGNDTTTDVYLDFTEIIGSGAFATLTQEVEDISTRVSTIEGSYIKEINIPESSVDEQFKTITITTSVDGESIDSSFDIADTAYYDLVASNFETLNADCSTFANSLTWQGLN